MRDKIAGVIEDITGYISHTLTDAIIEALPDMIEPLAMLERRNGYWGGNCSYGYQVAHTNGDMYRVRLHGKVVCRDIKGFQRAVNWANDHHRAQIMAAFGVKM